jgi:fumarylacetoacetase
VPIEQVQLHLPVAVGGFTDFSCSKEHLQNMGQIMGAAPMPPGALHFPIGYGGRASSVVVSGTPIVRPNGQFYEAKGSTNVVFGPSRSMDYELEMAAVIGRPTELGDVVSIKDADEHIFGLVLLNDWSGAFSCPLREPVFR